MEAEQALLTLCQENLAYCRQHESHRATMTTMVVAVATGLTGFILVDGVGWTDVLPATLLFFLGWIGLRFSQQHYERFSHHYERFRAYRAELERRISDLTFGDLNEAADKRNDWLFRRLPRRSITDFWLLPHKAVCLAAVFISLLAVWSIYSSASTW